MRGHNTRSLHAFLLSGIQNVWFGNRQGSVRDKTVITSSTPHDDKSCHFCFISIVSSKGCKKCSLCLPRHALLWRVRHGICCDHFRNNVHSYYISLCNSYPRHSQVNNTANWSKIKCTHMRITLPVWRHSTPGSRRRRWKGNPSAWGCNWDTLSLVDINTVTCPPGWELDARLMALQCKKKYCCGIQRSENRMVQFTMELTSLAEAFREG